MLVWVCPAARASAMRCLRSSERAFMTSWYRTERGTVNLSARDYSGSLSRSGSPPRHVRVSPSSADRFREGRRGGNPNSTNYR
jgi:hypothetical protein